MVSQSITIVLLGLFTALYQLAGVQSIGVCYGMLGNNLPSPAEVISLYQTNGIGGMRLFDPNPSALQSLRGTNIQVILGVSHSNLHEIANNPSAADSWVQNNVISYWPDVRIRYIAVGNEIIPRDNSHVVLPAMQNIYNAIVRAGLQDQIKVSTAIDTGVLGNSYPPSQGAFTAQSRNFLHPIIRFLVNTRAPLLVNLYTYFSYVGNPNAISLSYALFTSQSVVVSDGQYGYKNLFDAILDAMYAALEKTGGSDVEIVISESGWPSAGGNAATIDNARTYNQNLIRHVGLGQGTPRKPGRAIDTYIFALFNENQKSSGIEQNFGLFYPNKQPVYPIVF